MNLTNETNVSQSIIQFERLNLAITKLETDVSRIPAYDLSTVLQSAMDLVNQILSLYASCVGKQIVTDQDVLVTFKRFVKGDPSLNAVRDNIRELVYYQNCVAVNGLDSLPKVPAKMAVRTVRHIYLYLRSRVEQAK